LSVVGGYRARASFFHLSPHLNVSLHKVYVHMYDELSSTYQYQVCELYTNEEIRELIQYNANAFGVGNCCQILFPSDIQLI
jgi:hypothetical protein